MKDKITLLIDKHINKTNQITTDLYNEKYKYSLEKMNELEKNEPCKLFKKSHKKWEKEKDNLLKNVNSSYDDLINSYKDIENEILNKKDV